MKRPVVQDCIKLPIFFLQLTNEKKLRLRDVLKRG